MRFRRERVEPDPVFTAVQHDEGVVLPVVFSPEAIALAAGRWMSTDVCDLQLVQAEDGTWTILMRARDNDRSLLDFAYVNQIFFSAIDLLAAIEADCEWDVVTDLAGCLREAISSTERESA